MSEVIKYITASVIIKNNIVFCNGEKIFEHKESKDFLINTYEALDNQYPKFYKMDVLGKLGMIATNILLKDFDFGKYKPEDVGIVLSNKNSSIEADVNYFESAKTFPSPALFVYTLPNIVMGEISIRYKFKGENAFFINDTFDAQWLSFYIKQLFEKEKIKACIGGWIDSINGMNDVCLFLVEASPYHTSPAFSAAGKKKKEWPFASASLKEIYVSK